MGIVVVAALAATAAGPSAGDDHGSLPGQLARHLRQTIDSTFGPAVDDRDVLTLDESDLFQALAECGKTRCHAIRRPAVEKADHRHRRLLRARRERPCRHTAAEKCDEFPPPHGAYPKAKDHGSTIAGQGRTSQQKPPARRASASGRLMRGGGPGAGPGGC